MGACLPKPTNVNPKTKFFNVCCGGKVIIENSEIDGEIRKQCESYGIKENKKNKKAS